MAKPPAARTARPPDCDRYLALLIRNRVPEKMRPWYLRRAEAFLKGLR